MEDDIIAAVLVWPTLLVTGTVLDIVGWEYLGMISWGICMMTEGRVTHWTPGSARRMWNFVGRE